eukprot:scaffold26636_cov153-Skeletonema_menzelii.AAC.18
MAKPLQSHRHRHFDFFLISPRWAGKFENGKNEKCGRDLHSLTAVNICRPKREKGAAALELHNARTYFHVDARKNNHHRQQPNRRGALKATYRTRTEIKCSALSIQAIQQK